jgi:uncharacterized protein with von Willebrand factor type A (vWA) domain
MDRPLDMDDRGLQPVPIDDVERAAKASSEGSGYLLGHLLRFGQLLRLMGMDVSTGQILDLVEALQHITITRRFDFYHTCKAMLVNRREDFLVFDQAFHLFWQANSPRAQEGRPPSGADVKRARLPSSLVSTRTTSPGGDEGDGRKPGQEENREAFGEHLMIYSPDETFRQKDFGEMTWEEIQAAKRAIASLEWNLGERRTRRVRPSSKGRINMRRMIRDNLRHGGEPINLAYRQRVLRPRPLVILSDISGSMERYSRMLLHFIHALTHGLRDTQVEAFVFGTRLTRITRHLRYKDVDESLDEVSQAVCDWSGGTRIGEAIKAFNFQWGRRVLGRGAVVLIISDGWDRGDLALLGKEILRLQRATYRLIWLNPLLGSDEYQPVQRGMATVIPCLDDFLPIHSLASLEQLAELLSTVTAIRPVRKQRVCSPETESPKRDEEASTDPTEPNQDSSWAERISRHLDLKNTRSPSVG